MQVAFLYVATVLIWGSTWSAIPYQFGIVAEEVSVAYRFALASMFLFAYAAATGREIRIPRKHYGMVIISGSLMFSLNYLFTYYAISYVTSGLVAVGFGMMVITNALFERLFFKTKLESRLVAGSLIGTTGMILLFWPEIGAFNLQDETFVGLVLTMVAVILASLGNMAVIVSSRRNLSVISVNAHGMIWGAVISMLVALFLRRDINFSFETEYLLSLAYLSLFGSAIVFGCYLALMRSIGSARAAYTTVLIPIVALLISTVIEDYRWSTLAVVGVFFIAFGNWLVLSRATMNEENAKQ